jgi:hypothetical protein
MGEQKFRPVGDVMTNVCDAKFAMFELYLATVEKATDRRASANSWMLSVNSAIVALYGYLQSDKVVDGATQRAWLWVIPAAGAIVCLAWMALLVSYRKLISAKFDVISELEASLPTSPFTQERKIYEKEGRRSLSQIEILIPVCFAVLYMVMLILHL